MSDAIVMSAEALEALHAEIALLEGEGRREIAARIRVAREWGDLKENAEYHDAKKKPGDARDADPAVRETALNAEVREMGGGGLGRGGARQPRDRRGRGARARVRLHARPLRPRPTPRPARSPSSRPSAARSTAHGRGTW